jgi:hypothetical protein
MSCGVLRNCGTHKHIGVSASHGTAQFWSNPLPSKGFWARGLSRSSGAGVGQQVKPRTCRAGGVWVRGNAYSHKATSQENMNESPQQLARPLSTGEHTTLPHVGSRQTLCNIWQSLWQVNPGVHCEKHQRIKTTKWKGGMSLCNISQYKWIIAQSLLQVNSGCDLSREKNSCWWSVWRPKPTYKLQENLDDQTWQELD